MAQKPTVPRGTRDFNPVEMNRRNYIFNTISMVFKQSGYKQIETPTMENLSTLTGKYGTEGDNLIFKIINSGDFLVGVDNQLFNDAESRKILPLICEKGLRYDLTVPFARFVVQHRNEITFPFKRFQIQPVWRADRPQKGRYREFYQCDADVIGSNSLLNEVELIRIVDSVFRLLDINVTIKLNNRKLLAAIAEKIGHPDKLIDITIAIDKLDKIGYDKVVVELNSKGIDGDSMSLLEVFINLEGKTFDQKRICLGDLLGEIELGIKGLEEVDRLFSLIGSIDLKCNIDFDLNLARGLNYYTGTIIEVVSDDVSIGSICGGGRYDDLTGIFGLDNVSGVGISFGADRIYDVLLQLEKFPQDTSEFTKTMFINFGDKEEKYILPLQQMLHSSGISAEIYPDQAKIKKQMSYADINKIPFVIIAGESEMVSNTVTVKDMVTGQQDTFSRDKLVEYFTGKV